MLAALPDFNHFVYEVVPTSGVVLRAWPKARELERRLRFYCWAELINDPAEADHRVLLNDA